jgi:hypothetical protein
MLMTVASKCCGSTCEELPIIRRKRIDFQPCVLVVMCVHASCALKIEMCNFVPHPPPFFSPDILTICSLIRLHRTALHVLSVHSGRGISSGLQSHAGLIGRQCFYWLLDHGALLNAQDVDGRTPLALASMAEVDDAVQVLLSRGADPDISDGRLWTPLMHSALRHNQKISRMLAAAGADLKMVNDDGKMARDLTDDVDVYDAIERTEAMVQKNSECCVVS